MSNLILRRDARPAACQLPRDSFFAPFEQVFDQLFNEVRAPAFFDRAKSNVLPKMNISESGNDFTITVNVAGVTPEDLKVEVEDKLLRITGKAHTESEEKETYFYIKELTQRQFCREVKLPENIEGDPEASVKNGILTLKWKFPEIKEEPSKVKVIEVKQE